MDRMCIPNAQDSGETESQFRNVIFVDMELIEYQASSLKVDILPVKPWPWIIFTPWHPIVLHPKRAKEPLQTFPNVSSTFH